MAGAEGIHACDEWLRLIAAAAALGAGDRDGARVELQALEAAGARLRRGDHAFMHYLRVLARGPRRRRRRAPDGKRRWRSRSPWKSAYRGWSASRASPRPSCSPPMATAAAPKRRYAARRTSRSGSAAPCSAYRSQLAAAGTAIHARRRGCRARPLKDGIRRWRGSSDLRYVAAVRPQATRRALRARAAPRHRARIRARAGARQESPATAFRPAREAVAAAVPGVRAGRIHAAARIRAGRVLEQGPGPADGAAQGAGRARRAERAQRPARRRVVAARGRGLRAQVLHHDAAPAAADISTTTRRSTLRDTRLSLDPRRVWVDTWALDQLLSELDGALRDPRPRAAGPVLSALADEALALYRGPFLPDESEQPSFIACREQMRAKLLRCLARVARWWEDNGKPEAAVDCYLRCIDADGLCEAVLSQPDAVLPAPRRTRRSRRDLRAAAHAAVGPAESHAVTGNAGGVRAACSRSKAPRRRPVNPDFRVSR